MHNLYSNNNSLNLDAAQTIFFLQELNKMKTKIYERELPIMKANVLIPISYDTDKGAETVSYRTFNRTVNGKVISNYADDLPTVEVMGELFTNPIRSYGDSFIISVQDINAAMLVGRDISSMKARAALESHMIWMNNTAFVGDSIAGLTGWINNPLIPTAPVSGDTPQHQTWAWKADNNPAAIASDIMEILSSSMLASDGLYQADTLVMPLAQFSLIQGLRLGNTSDTTILEYVTETSKAINNRGVKFEWANELKGAFGGLDGMIAYRYNPDDFYQEIPMEFTMLEPQWNNLAYKIPCMSRHGGTVIIRPKTQAIRTGI